MTRASFIPRSPLLMLAVALVAVAALFAGGAPAEAQAPATVTRWVPADSTKKIHVPVEVRAGNYYKVLMPDELNRQQISSVARAREGNLGELYVVVGTLVGIPDFECTTHAGTADENDYVGGVFPMPSTTDVNGVVTSKWGTDGYQTLPIVTKAEDVDPDATPPKENVLELNEYFEVECLPTGTGGNLWRADGSARLRIQIIDQALNTNLESLRVKSSTDGSSFPTTLTLSPPLTSQNLNNTNFSAGAGSAVTHVKVQPTTQYQDATVTVNGVAVDSGSDSAAIAIGDGYNDINVQVTAADGSTTRDYKVTVKKMPAAHLSDLEVLDEYGSLVMRPEFIASYPGQSQMIFVAPGIRRIKVKPHWPAGSTMSVEVSTTDMTDKSTLSTATVTTSGTKSGYLTLSSLGFGATKLNVTVTEGSTTTKYPKKYMTRELDAANADNYLNYMGVSPNPNARAGRSFSGQSSPGFYNVLHHNQGAADYLIRNISYQSAGPLPLWPPAFGYARVLPSDPYTPAEGLPQQNSGSITLTPSFDPEVHEYSATVPYGVTSVVVNLGLSHPKATATVNGNSPSTPVSLEVGENVVEVVVTAESGVRRTYTLTITREPSNLPAAVSSALADVALANESGTRQVSLSGVFTDPDGDDLTVTASSSDEDIATVSVSADHSTLTVSAKSEGAATVTVTASDGKGGEVSDAFTVTVKAAPVVASPIADIGGLEAGDSRTVSLSGVFSDADGDSLTVTAASSDEAKATVSVASDRSALMVSGVSEGTATITVAARDADGNTVSDAFDVTVTAPPNNAPTVAGAIPDATIVNTSGTHEVALSGVFGDADGDSLTFKAASSSESVATVAVSSDTLTVSAKSSGTATVTVTASDGKGGEVSDSFTVTVKAAPVLASAIADVSGLESGDSRVVSLSGVFTDADGDSLTVTAASSDNAKATVAVAADQSALTVYGVAEGTATITVAAQDADGNTVNDAFDVMVAKAPEPEPEPVELPGPVVNLQLTATDDGVIVSWSAPESGDAPRRYIVHIRPEGGENGSGRTKTPRAKKTKVTFENLEAGRTYKVWVRAENEAGKGERVRAGITIPAAQ